MMNVRSKGKGFRLQGHQVLARTTSRGDRYACQVVLFDPRQRTRPLKSFVGTDAERDRAEKEAIEQAVAFLDTPPHSDEELLADRSTVIVAGHTIDVFCDVGKDGSYQAFPFLRRADGSRSIMMQFHLRESITGETPAEAFRRCVQRLRDYFTPAGARTA